MYVTRIQCVQTRWLYLHGIHCRYSKVWHKSFFGYTAASLAARLVRKMQASELLAALLARIPSRPHRELRYLGEEVITFRTTKVMWVLRKLPHFHRTLFVDRIL
ncbi:unnamed protein product [Ceratitis capitata]|uniref:(Mediterranean fruit fly) hypothetical protein n=1 Tax=Ceratitis capitata TaxID=7213 RepID=A0A811URE2_CERCA|nr:unnamed protein product [Ceratitis capitata]